MIKVNLTDEEKKQLVEETNLMIEECDELVMDITGLTEQASRIGLYNKIFDKENRFLYKKIENTIRIKSRRLLTLREKIEINKEKLGLKKIKKKNKTLI